MASALLPHRQTAFKGLTVGSQACNLSHHFLDVAPYDASAGTPNAFRHYGVATPGPWQLANLISNSSSIVCFLMVVLDLLEVLAEVSGLILAQMMVCRGFRFSRHWFSRFWV
ncbi:hypothetical protein AMTR_s00008p00050730 [Amborella trichopoda]|uniref:Uncharacterized protein n=1 Tax=Amborella trichopoda TaxID=13333 RepID=W1NHK6_AMBTC|nr:hypothetical protein AMTR_s00008p00050730 [Amborella trichopoda]